MLRFLRKSGWLLSLLSITACGQLPPDYSPHYVKVPVVSSTPPYKVKEVLVPEACLRTDPTADTTLGETLPPGCANAYNLQRMAERKRDLVKGRKLGHAPAGPSARAAENYLNGANKEPRGGAVSQGVGASVDGGTSTATPNAATLSH